MALDTENRWDQIYMTNIVNEWHFGDFSERECHFHFTMATRTSAFFLKPQRGGLCRRHTNRNNKAHRTAHNRLCRERTHSPRPIPSVQVGTLKKISTLNGKLPRRQNVAQLMADLLKLSICPYFHISTGCVFVSLTQASVCITISS